MANIAIFRINYKSDFILTLNSDAGWMTPFCIKFWTGAPSQAYFVGFDGTTYTHCAPVDGEPTKLLVQFDDHHLPIGDLKFQIGYHFTVADFPTSIEDEVINQAAVIIDNDGEQQQVMLDFTGETAPEIEFSLPAYANEAQRIANESQRIANEEQRIATETQRIANEEQRISQEQTRQQNEVQRIVQEQARVTAERERFNDYAKLKVDAIAATDAANSAAALANEKAQLAADKAALAQSASALATEKAQLAADKAALAQSAATLANDKAALAQQKAEYATAQGDYAKAQGDYAKAQGDYAKAQAGVIPTDVTRTQTDATFVNGNHDPLFYLRQANSSLAGLMTAAGYTKLNDMPAAQEVNAGLAYDVSVLHPTSGVNGGSTYASLSAALAVIPQDKRKGGMTVKFVLSSDNKYVQYFLTKDEWSASEDDWQKLNLEEEVNQLGLKVTYGEETQIQGTLESGYFGTAGRNTAGFVKVFDVSGLTTLVRVTTSTNNPYVVLWVLSAVQVNVGDNYSNTLAHSGVTSDINEDTIDLSLYPTAKYLYVANFYNTDISSAYARTGGLIDINEHLSALDDEVSRIDNSLANTNENVDSLDETINGQERTIETIIQSVSTVAKARIDNALRRVYLSVFNSTLAVKFYPIVQGKEYSIHIPKMWNEYSYYWGYTNNYPPSGELIQAWDSVNGLIADTTTGDGEKTINITSAANYGYIAVCYDTTGGNPTVKQYEVIIENGIKQDTERLISEEDTVSVNLPNKIFAVVGDKLQLFYRGIIKAIDPYKYDIVVSCSKGNAFPRYYELTPTVSETLDFSILVKNAKGTILAEGSTQIVCKNAISPATLKNILCFGDSLTSGGEWVNEANRRLTLDTVVDGIAGSNLNNIAFCGSKTTQNGAGYFGVGGWSWGTYMSQGVTMYRANVSNVSSCQVGAVYRVNGYLYEVIEVNITAGTGTILLSKYSSYSQPAPPASGTLVKVGGYGDSEISYSSYVEETYSPLWNNGSADFINYAHENANDQIDVVVTLLTWNDGSTGNDFNNFDSDRTYMTLFGNTLHSQFPTAKWLLLGIQLPSINGGIGQNNGANGVTAWGVTKSVFNKNDFYQEFANDDSFKSFTKFINISSQFDSENNMQEAAVRVNTRNTKTEERGTNAVHPALSGYMQIADIVFRSIIGELS